jgi:hypothetical protein
MFTMDQQPLYTLPPRRIRIIFPQVVLLPLLAVLVYILLVINLSFIRGAEQYAEEVKLATIIILALLSVGGIIRAIVRSGKPFLFYHDSITWGRKRVMLVNVVEVRVKRNLFDVLFGTYALLLRLSRGRFRIRAVAKDIDLAEFVRGLVAQAKVR